jgi:multicomponent Na+:H+ antiporter subunit D
MNLLLDNIIPLQVILLFLGAALIPFVSKSGWIVSFISIYTCALLSSVMIFVVKKFGYMSYVFGGFALPYGIEFRFDPLSVAFVSLITIGVLPIIIYGFLAVKLEIAESKRHLFYSLLLFNLAGNIGMVLAYDLFTVYVFIEIASLTAYGLVASGKSRRSAYYAYNYLIVGTIGASFYLLGIGIIFALTGTLNMGDVAIKLASLPVTNLLGVSYLCIMVGLLLKIGIFPFHAWVPGVLSSAPSVVSSVFSIASSNVLIYLIIRLFFNVLNIDVHSFISLQKILIIMTVITIIASGIAAMNAKEFRKMMAYSSLMHYSLVLFAVAIASKASMISAFVMIFAHAIAKSGLFMSAGFLSMRNASLFINVMPGTFIHSPWTTSAFVINLIAVSGIPPLINFLGKWQLLVASFRENIWFIAVAIISTLFGLLYGLRVIDQVLFKSEVSQVRGSNSEILMKCSILLTSVMIILMTLCGGVLFEQSDYIATFLLSKI